MTEIPSKSAKKSTKGWERQGMENDWQMAHVSSVFGPIEVDCEVVEKAASSLVVVLGWGLGAQVC